jgi:hypothetical protein
VEAKPFSAGSGMLFGLSGKGFHRWAAVNIVDPLARTCRSDDGYLQSNRGPFSGANHRRVREGAVAALGQRTRTCCTPPLNSSVMSF